MKILVGELRLAVLFLLAFSASSFAASWDHINKDAFDSLPLQSVKGIELSQTKRELISLALNLGVNEKVSLLAQHKDQAGNLHSRYQQTYNGLPVWGQQLTLHERAGKLYRAQGKIARGLKQDLDTQISRPQPKSIAGQNSPYLEKALHWLQQKSGDHASQASLNNVSEERAIYFLNGKAVVVQVVSLLATYEDKAPLRPTVIVQENNLEILKAWDRLAHTEATGPGGNEKVGRYEYGTDYGYLDVTETDSVCTLANDNVYTVDLQNSYNDTLTVPFDFPCYENTSREINGAYSPLNDAHYFGNVVFDMYQDWFGLAPLTFQLAMKVHYGEGYENAYWDGASMVFGDGQTIFYPLVDINVVSHEVSHGFTEQNSNLIYSGKSGGINESFSDIAGEAAEFYIQGSVDWLNGAAITKNTPALRYFEDPTQDGISIGHASGYFQGMDVHHSSGVFNRAYYLIATSAGWDPQSAFSLFVHANRFYWQPDTDFDLGSCGVLNAAEDLGYNKAPVALAFAQVGVFCLSDDTDSDTDGMPDTWELRFGLNPSDPSDALGDLDEDGVNNATEFQYQSNPTLEDSDSDSLSDSDEIYVHGTSPILADSDEDEMPDGFEVQYDLDPLDPTDALLDLDGDGVSNLDEYRQATDPSDPDDFLRPISFLVESFEVPLSSNWETSSDHPLNGWSQNADWSTHGSHSFAATGLASGQSATLRFSALFDAGKLFFDARTSTEACCDPLYLYVDGVQKVRIAGINIQHVSIDLPAGFHTLEFVYRKDGSVDGFLDTVWIDGILFESDNTDVDADGISNEWEMQYGFDPENPADAALDFDGDGATNLQEFEHDSNPTLTDTDGDTLSDGDEINVHGTSPILADTDSDEMDDAYEISYGLNPTDPLDADLDLDGDGSSNLAEFYNGTDPTDPDDFLEQLEVYFESFEAGLPSRWSTSSTSGVGGWATNSNWSNHGTASFAATGLADNDNATLQFSGLFAAGTFYFEYRVSTEACCDYLSVYLDDVLQFNLSGTQAARAEMALDAGLHTIRFVYRKDGSVSTNEDSVWIDSVIFETSNLDIDNDGMPNQWEMLNNLDPLDPADAAQDLEGDGATNLQEFQHGSNPALADSDGDTLSDGDEINIYGSNPLLIDSDGDELDDAYEAQYGLDPTDPTDAALDSDGDGTTNLEEFQRGTDPTDPNDVIIPIGFMALTFEDNQLPIGWDITSTGSAQWQLDTAWASQGHSSLAATGMASGTLTTLRFDYWTTAGTLHVDFRTRFVPGILDEFQIYIDGDRQFYVSQYADFESSWQHSLSAGPHTIEIQYQRNATIENESTAWIDALWFESDDTDVDGDDLPNAWELRHNLNPQEPADRDQDLDIDQLTNFEEFEAGSNPRKPDTDDDGADDAVEVRTSNTLVDGADSDFDGMSDGFEITYGLNPLDPDDAELDNDDDTLSNLDEFRLNLNPISAASSLNPLLTWADSFEDGPADQWILLSQRSTNWSTSDAWSSDGGFSLAQENMPYYSSASAEITALFAAGNFSYDFNVDSDYSQNFLDVFVDDEPVARHTINSGQGSITLNLSAGVHSIRFVANHPFHYGNTSMYIDNVRFATSSEDDPDGDGIPSAWEAAHGLDPTDPNDALEDPDADGLSNLQEYERKTDPAAPNVDLQISMTKLFETISDEVKYRIRVTNLGQIDATNVLVLNSNQSNLYLNDVPSDTSIVTCSSVGRDEHCSVPYLAPGELISFDLLAGVQNSSDKHVFVSTVSADEEDYDPDNNEASGEYAGSLHWIMLAMLSALYWARRRAGMRH